MHPELYINKRFEDRAIAYLCLQGSDLSQDVVDEVVAHVVSEVCAYIHFCDSVVSSKESMEEVRTKTRIKWCMDRAEEFFGYYQRHGSPYADP